MTYRELDELSQAFGAWLQKMGGFKKGERIAIMLPNVLQYPVAMFGAIRAGFAVVNIDPMCTARELEHRLKDSGAVCIVVFASCAHLLQEVLSRTGLKHVIVTSVGDLLGTVKGRLINFIVRRVRKQVPRWHIIGSLPFRQVLSEGRQVTLEPVAVGPEDITRATQIVRSIVGCSVNATGLDVDHDLAVGLTSLDQIVRLRDVRQSKNA